MRAIKDVARVVPLPEGTPFEVHERNIERASVEHSLANLRTFPWIRMKENQRELTIHGAWFDIAMGELHLYNEGATSWEEVKGE
jgi:carbonic anhydrase